MVRSLLRRLGKLQENGSYLAMLHPRVLANDLLFERELTRRPDVMRSRPRTVEIEVTNRCNLACVQCLRSRGLKPYTLGDVTPEAFARILDQFPEALHVCLNGFGEPLMHPRFFELVAHSRRRLPWAKISVYTNGTLLDPATVERVLGSGLNEINVSIDAAFPSTYRKVRRGGSLDVVQRNLCDLVERRRRRGAGLPLVGVNFVMLNENEGELVPFVEQAAEAGVDFVNCVSYATYDWGLRNRRTPESYQRELVAARRALDSLGLACRILPSADMTWAAADRRFDCTFPWGDGVRVTFEGEVTLGCCTPFKETYSYGNVLETPFARMWNGELFRFNREKTRRGEPPNDVCARCHDVSATFFQPTEAAGARVVRLPLAGNDAAASAACASPTLTSWWRPWTRGR